MTKRRIPKRPPTLRVLLYCIGGALFGVLARILEQDMSWPKAALIGLGFTLLYGVFFDAWYRRRIFQQEMEDNTHQPS